MQVASCGNITTGAGLKSRALGMRTLVRYSCLEKEPKREQLATFKLQLFRQGSTEVQHQYACINKRNYDFRVMTPLSITLRPIIRSDIKQLSEYWNQLEYLIVDRIS